MPGRLHLSMRRNAQSGFTLFETILVLGLIALAVAAIQSLQPRLVEARLSTRDQAVGIALMQGCAERLLAVRRQSGYAAVTNGLCAGMGGIGGFAADVQVNLADARGIAVSSCSSATCTATVLAAKGGGGAAPLTALTLQFSAY